MKVKKNRKIKTKAILSIIIFIILLVIVIWLGIQVYQENTLVGKQNKIEYMTLQNDILQNMLTGKNVVDEKNIINDIQQEQVIQNNKEELKVEQKEILKNYKGYTVEAKLDIPKIELETYVLIPYSTQALNTSVTKFWGANANEIGNFCIAGHNFQNKMMFRNLKKLKIGDKLFVEDNKNGKVEYIIYNIYTVLPEDVSCLSQDTGGEREVTLITCTNDSQKRIIVKAKNI